MFLRRSILPLASKQIKTVANQLTGFSWIDYLVNVTKSSGNVRIDKLFLVVLSEFCSFLLLIFSSCDLLPEDYVNGSIRTYHSNLVNWKPPNSYPSVMQ